MTNNYPQIAVLGCDSNKANLYYDIQRQVWVEHLVSPCINDEESILKFCQQAYPSLNIGNIVRLDQGLRFKNWCTLLPSIGDSIPLCRTENSIEEVVQPYRCLLKNSDREELALPNIDCVRNSITGSGECLRAEKWQQFASLDCSNKTMILNSSTVTTNWCGLAQFRGIEFVCCPLKNSDSEDDYPTSLDEDDDNTLKEDDSIKELIIVPTTSTVETHRKIIAMSLGLNEPNWILDYQQWNTDSGYFSDDEDVTDDQEETKSKPSLKSELTINEHERFLKDKEEFKRKNKEQIDDLKSRWQKRQNEIQSIANENPTQAQVDYENTEIEFRQEYDIIKQTATQERTRINELHETNLDNLLDNAKTETNQKLINAWNEKPLKAENVEDALYNYLHALLRDRIHLVNRYERLRAVDPEQANLKRVSIHERLISIANRINNALNKLRRNSKLQSKIQPRIDALLNEYEEVNQAAERLLIDYLSSISTTSKDRLLPLGQDEKKIYPFAPSQENKVDENNNDEYAYDTNAEYNDDDSTTRANVFIKDQIDDGRSNWDVGIDNDITLDVKIESDETLRLMPINNKNTRSMAQNFLITYLPYIIGILFLLCVMFGIIIIRFIIEQRRKYRYGGNYEKNYVFSEVDCYTAEEKALHALQMNGYENPTYKFFETQTPKC